MILKTWFFQSNYTNNWSIEVFCIFVNLVPLMIDVKNYLLIIITNY
mgnify:CR=1